MTAGLILKRSPLGPEQNQDDFDVLADDVIVGRIFFVSAAMPGKQWMWTLGYGHHEDRTPTHGYEPTREAAIAARRRAFKAYHRWCALGRASGDRGRSARMARRRRPSRQPLPAALRGPAVF